MKTQNRYAFTGRMRIGKDYVAKAIGGAVLGFADPFYEIARNLFPGLKLDKDKTPGLRKLYQELGQIGRGELSAEYPLSLSRAVIVDWWRHNGDRFCSMPINWTSFGSNDRIWADCLLARVEQLLNPDYCGMAEIPPPVGIVCVSNIRFPNERSLLQGAGWDVWHVLASRPTWEERLRGVGLFADDPKLEDLSEQLAITLDKRILEAARKPGPKMRVIWNDKRTSPSERFFTLPQFKTYVDNHRNPTEGTPTPADAGAGDLHVPQSAPDSGAGGPGDRNAPAGRRVGRTPKG
jgi:hypothetical protein